MKSKRKTTNTPSKTAQLFANGGSQAVRLPKDCRFTGSRVAVQRVGEGVLLTPLKTKSKKANTAWDDFFAVRDAVGVGDDFMAIRPLNEPPQHRDNLFD